MNMHHQQSYIKNMEITLVKQALLMHAVRDMTS